MQFFSFQHLLNIVRIVPCPDRSIVWQPVGLNMLSCENFRPGDYIFKPALPSN
jgi:hypothetical protein